MPDIEEHINNILGGLKDLLENKTASMIEKKAILDGLISNYLHAAGDLADRAIEYKSAKDQTFIQRERSEATSLLRANNAINSMLVGAQNQQQIFEDVCRLLVEEGKFRMSWIGMLNEETLQIEAVAVYGDTFNYVNSIKVYADERPEGMGPAGTAFRERRTVVIHDAMTDPRIAPWAEQRRNTPWISSIAIPINFNEKTIAVVTVYSNNKNYFSEKEVNLLEALAHNIQITLERKELKDSLVSNQKRLENVITSANLGTWEWNVRTGVTHFNKFWAEILGYNLEELQPTSLDTWKKLTHPDDLQMALEQLEEHFNGLRESFSIDVRMKHKDGSWMWILAQGKVIEWDTLGNPELMFGTHTDITTRKQTEENLRLNEEKFRNIFDQSMVGLSFNTMDGIHTVNQTYCDMFGYTSEELLNIKWQDITPPDDIALGESIIRDILSGKLEYHHGEKRYVHKDGSIVWTEINTKMQKNADGSPSYLISAITNITERKKAEQVIRESEEKFRNVFDQTLVGLSFNDLDGNLNVNEAYVQMLGYSKEELSKMKWHEITHPDDVKEGKKNLAALLSGEKETSSREKRYVHKNGNAVWVEVSSKVQRDKYGRPLYIITAANNITERKKAELELKESEEQFRILVEQASAGVAKVDVNTGNFVQINNKYANIVGYSIEEMLNINFKSITHPDDYYAHVKQTDLLKSGAIKEFTLEKRYIHKNGNTVWVELFISPMWKKGDVPDYFITIASDITIRKQAEILEKQNAELLIAKQKAELSAQLSSEFSTKIKKAKEKAEENDALKTAFLQNISHEIRTPLNAIMGFSNMLKDRTLSLEKIDTYSSIISSSSSQLLSIVTDVLTISSLETKQEKVNFKNVIINEVVRDLYTILLMQVANTNVQLKINPTLPDELSEIYTDRTKITQIITNLVSNALKFTGEGIVEFGYNLKGSNLEFYVKDTGIGISPEKQSVIFERFQQADQSISRNYGGTGLGLSISKGFVELLGGEIWVESTPDNGSIFYFTIPYTTSHFIAANSMHPHKRNKTATILIAEDMEINFLFLSELLIEKNCQILRAKNGQEAVEICRENPLIDAVLMDIKMPVMDGYIASGLIKECCPDLVIIAQSGFPLDPTMEAENNYPFKHYLSKPIDKNELFFVLQKFTSVF